MLEAFGLVIGIVTLAVTAIAAISLVVAALVMTLWVEAAAGVLPARKAAALDPIEALRAE